MKGGTLIITNLVILAVGILLLFVFRHPAFVDTIIIVTGILFIIPAVVNLLAQNRQSKSPAPDGKTAGTASRITTWITCCAAIIFGATMIIAPEAFRRLFVYIFALTLILGGAYHLYIMWRGLRPARVPAWMFAVPFILAAGGIAIFIVPGLLYDQSNVILITGIGLTLFALTSFAEIIAFNRWQKTHRDYLLTEPES